MLLNEKILKLQAYAKDVVEAIEEIKRSRNRLLNEYEAAHYLGVKPSTLRVYRSNEKGPKCIKEKGLGVKYDIRDLDAYVDSRPRNGNIT